MIRSVTVITANTSSITGLPSARIVTQSAGGLAVSPARSASIALLTGIRTASTRSLRPSRSVTSVSRSSAGSRSAVHSFSPSGESVCTPRTSYSSVLSASRIIIRSPGVTRSRSSSIRSPVSARSPRIPGALCFPDPASTVCVLPVSPGSEEPSTCTSSLSGRISAPLCIIGRETWIDGISSCPIIPSPKSSRSRYFTEDRFAGAVNTSPGRMSPSVSRLAASAASSISATVSSVIPRTVWMYASSFSRYAFCASWSATVGYSSHPSTAAASARAAVRRRIFLILRCPLPRGLCPASRIVPAARG